MDILIRGAGFVNKGVEAMMHTVKNELGRRIEDARFCWRVVPERAQEVEMAGFKPLVIRGGKLRKFGSLTAAALLDPQVLKSALVSPRAALQIKDLKNISAIVDMSGFSYSDEWGHENSKQASVLVEYFAKKGKPCLFLPQSWGPFNQPLVARYVKSFCQKASVIYARDQRSYDYLVELLGIRKANIRLAPDIAFRFKAAEPKVGSDLLAKHGIKPGTTPIVGLVPNVLVYERITDSGTDNLYVQAMIDIVEHCIDKLGTAVILIPHASAYGKDCKTNDSYLCNVIKDAIDKKGKKFVFTMSGERYPAEAVKSAIGHLDLLVGSRYHSLIAALSSRVPAVALGWSHKYADLMQLVSLDNCTVNYTELEMATVLEKISDAWAKRRDNRQILKNRLPAIENDVDAVFDYAAEVIEASR